MAPAASMMPAGEDVFHLVERIVGEAFSGEADGHGPGVADFHHIRENPAVVVDRGVVGQDFVDDQSAMSRCHGGIGGSSRRRDGRLADEPEQVGPR